MGCFSGVGLGLLVLVKGNLNASAYQDIMHNAILWESFGESPISISA